jgi:hypothetical protein
VALSDDVPELFRYPGELRRLAGLVRKAGDNDETRWLEWKSSLDLAGANGTKHIAKQILGFANREPAVAVRWAQGHAYIVIGASPGRLEGVTPVDPERLVSQITPYVGSRITWTPEYVTVEGTEVLIIIVDPPRRGDPIHALRKDLETYRVGAVFIRRPGQVVQANADELDMLQRRLLDRAEQIELTVTAADQAIEVRPDFEGHIKSWVERERANRMALCQPREEEPHTAAGFSMLIPPISREARERYAEQVSAYLDEVETALLRRGIRQLEGHPGARLTCIASNSTGSNFAQVRVILTTDASAARVHEHDIIDMLSGFAPELPDPPDPPDPYGVYAAASMVRDIRSCHPSLAVARPDRPRSAWKAVSTDGKLRIEYDPVDLRPLDELPLPPVPLIVTAEPGSAMTIDWEATATNVNGKAAGAIGISISPSTLTDDWMRRARSR